MCKATVRSGRWHDKKDDGGNEDDDAEENRGELDGERSDELSGEDGHKTIAGEGCGPGPGAELALVVVMDDGGEPATERVGTELRGREADEHEDFEKREVGTVEQGDGEADSCERREEGCVEAAAEADIQHGAEEEDPDAAGEHGSGDGGDSRFRYVLHGEKLRQRECDEARV